MFYVLLVSVFVSHWYTLEARRELLSALFMALAYKNLHFTNSCVMLVAVVATGPMSTHWILNNPTSGVTAHYSHFTDGDTGTELVRTGLRFHG